VYRAGAETFPSRPISIVVPFPANDPECDGSEVVDLPARFNDEQENANAGHSRNGERNKKGFHDLGSKKQKAGDDCADRRQQLPVIERRVR
jgi:hypothetical protein